MIQISPTKTVVFPQQNLASQSFLVSCETYFRVNSLPPLQIYSPPNFTSHHPFFITRNHHQNLQNDQLKIRTKPHKISNLNHIMKHFRWYLRNTRHPPPYRFPDPRLSREYIHHQTSHHIFFITRNHHQNLQNDQEDSSNQPQCTKSQPFYEVLSAVSMQHKTTTTAQFP